MAVVFLSYDHEDTALARPIARALEKAGHEVWWDQFIHGGAQYTRKIEQALDEVNAVVVLWSPRSVESAWVRDEAAEGRDRGKLVPLAVEGVTPPMGFRQFQTLDLGGWNGRRKLPRLKELLEAIESQAGRPAEPRPVIAAEKPPPERGSKRLWLSAAVAAVLLPCGLGAWAWFGRNPLPVVEVVAANSAPRSQAAASDLFVKLGSLAQLGQGKWKLVDAASAQSNADLVFRTADTSSAGLPTANLVLIDGKDDSLLWSREFRFPSGTEADLRQQLSLTAGRVLGCALESREAGGLPRDLLKLFLDACATLAEASNEEPEKVSRSLRAIVAAKPKFVPAWNRLLLADSGALDVAMYTGGAQTVAEQLRTDLERARQSVAESAEIMLAQSRLLPPSDYGGLLKLLASATERFPDSSRVFEEQAFALQRVGRMAESVAAARRAAELDPLSPGATSRLIMTLAYSGSLDAAREELSKAERLWAGTGALRDAQWAFHLRFGDPLLAKRFSSGQAGEGLDLFLDARADPSPAKVGRVEKFLQSFRGRNPDVAEIGWAMQALGEFDKVDEVFYWIARAPLSAVARDSDLLFRPALQSARRDPRFMLVMKRIGLLAYWQESGIWPDFCSDPGLSYDCKKEAARLLA